MLTVQEDSLIILDILPEGYIRFDGKLRFTFVNPAAQVILGKTGAELLGRKLGDVFPSSTGTPLEEACRRAISQNTNVTLEHQLEHSHAWCAITAMPDSCGGVVVRYSDVTDQKLMETALRTSEEKFSKAFHSNPVPMCIVDVEKNSCF